MLHTGRRPIWSVTLWSAQKVPVVDHRMGVITNRLMSGR